jgi:hypothetical protein
MLLVLSGHISDLKVIVPLYSEDVALGLRGRRGHPVVDIVCNSSHDHA